MQINQSTQQMFWPQVSAYVFMWIWEILIHMFLGNILNFYATSYKVHKNMLMETRQLTLQASVFSLSSFDRDAWELNMWHDHLAYNQFFQLSQSLTFFLSQKVSSSCLVFQIVVAVWKIKKHSKSSELKSQTIGLKSHYWSSDDGL